MLRLSLLTLCMLLIQCINAIAQPAIDSSFAANGYLPATIALGQIKSEKGSIAKLLVQPDGKILASLTGSSDFQTNRYLPNGKPDSNFGVAGKLFIRFLKR